MQQVIDSVRTLGRRMSESVKNSFKAPTIWPEHATMKGLRRTFSGTLVPFKAGSSKFDFLVPFSADWGIPFNKSFLKFTYTPIPIEEGGSDSNDSSNGSSSSEEGGIVHQYHLPPRPFEELVEPSVTEGSVVGSSLQQHLDEDDMSGAIAYSHQQDLQIHNIRRLAGGLLDMKTQANAENVLNIVNEMFQQHLNNPHPNKAKNTVITALLTNLHVDATKLVKLNSAREALEAFNGELLNEELRTNIRMDKEEYALPVEFWENLNKLNLVLTFVGCPVTAIGILKFLSTVKLSDDPSIIVNLIFASMY